MINLKIIKDAGFAGKATPPDAGRPVSKGKGKGGGIGGGKKGGIPATITELASALQAAYHVDPSTAPVVDDTGNGYDLSSTSAFTVDTPGQLYTNYRYSGTPRASINCDSTPFEGTGDFMISGWFYFGTLGGTNTPQILWSRAISSAGSPGANRSWSMYQYLPSGGSRAFNFWALNGTGGGVATSTWAPATGAWHFVVGGYRSSDYTAFVSVDGETLVTAAVGGPINNGYANDFLWNNGSGTTNWYGYSRYNDWGYFNVPPTQERVDALWNDGAGWPLTSEPFNLTGS